MLPFIVWVFRLLGFVGQGDTLLQRYEAKKKAQAVANSPETDEELIKIERAGKL